MPQGLCSYPQACGSELFFTIRQKKELLPVKALQALLSSRQTFLFLAPYRGVKEAFKEPVEVSVFRVPEKELLSLYRTEE
ncbi:MAG: hypothetical protein ABDH29_06615 [Aquificaceae bacterium]